MRQQSPEPRPDASQEPAGPPDELRPWYYQYWFLYPMIVFWPLWSVLIIRSPWHNGLVSGALAWALLIIGGYLSYVRFQVGGTVALSTVAIIAPGLIFVVITQVHWIMNRRRIMDWSRREPSASAAAAPEVEPDGPSRSRRARRRRSVRRRR